MDRNKRRHNFKDDDTQMNDTRHNIYIRPSATFSTDMLDIIVLSVIMLSFIVLCVIMPSVIMMRVILLCVILLSLVMPNAVLRINTLCVIMLSAIMLCASVGPMSIVIKCVVKLNVIPVS
jgi:hypothetical protein